MEGLVLTELVPVGWDEPGEGVPGNEEDHRAVRRRRRRQLLGGGAAVQLPRYRHLWESEGEKMQELNLHTSTFWDI